MSEYSKGPDILAPSFIILRKLRALLKDEDANMLDFVALAKIDMALSLDLIRHITIQKKKGLKRITAIEEVVMYLDYVDLIECLKLFLFKVKVTGVYDKIDIYYHQVWEKSILSAILMEAFVVAAKLDINPSFAYTIGLISQAGKAFDLISNTNKNIFDKKYFNTLEQTANVIHFFQVSEELSSPFNLSLEDQDDILWHLLSLANNLSAQFNNLRLESVLIPPATKLDSKSFLSAIASANRRLQVIQSFLHTF